MKAWALLSLVLAVVFGAEGFSAWWMKPPVPDPDRMILEWEPPVGGGATSRPELYQEVRGSLRCSSGWIGDLESVGRPVRVSFFRWDQTRTINTLEAFKHLPEQCMGSIGMRMDRHFAPRVLEIDGREVEFDVSLFRSSEGTAAVYVFKAVWVSGHEDATLRRGLSGYSGHELRRLRLAAAWNRFRPPHTRVLMGGISAVPTEELAWREFRRLVEPNLRWTSAGSLP